MQGDAQQRTCADNVVLRCILIKVFKGAEGPGDLLNLIENQQRVFRIDFSTGIDLQTGNQTLRVKIG